MAGWGLYASWVEVVLAGGMEEESAHEWQGSPGSRVGITPRGWGNETFPTGRTLPIPSLAIC